MIDRISYVRMQKLFDPFFPPGRYTYTKSNFFRALSDEAIEAMASFADTAPSPYIFAPFFEHWHRGRHAGTSYRYSVSAPAVFIQPAALVELGSAAESERN